MFCIQTLTKKGTITPLETVGIYTKKYENGIGVPRRLNEKEETALLSTMKKVNHVLDSNLQVQYPQFAKTSSCHCTFP